MQGKILAKNRYLRVRLLGASHRRSPQKSEDTVGASAQTNPVETYPGYNSEGVNPSYLSQTVPYFLTPVVALGSSGK